MRANYANAFSSIGKFLMLLPLMFFFISGLNAQVTIGSKEIPVDGTLLQLKNKEGVTGKEENATKGLGLPRVKLTDINQLYPMYESNGSGGYVGANKIDVDPKHAGLMVYNLTDALPFSEGVYIWDGEKWTVIAGGGGGVTPLPCTKAQITFPQSNIAMSVTTNNFKVLSANFTGTPTAMTWQKLETNGSWTNISGTNGNYYTPTQSGTYRFGVRDCETTAWYYSGNYIITVFDESGYTPNPLGPLTIKGVNCFDTRETFNNDKGDGQNGKETSRTISPNRPLPQGVTTYTIISSGTAIKSVEWIIEDKKGFLAAYSTETNSYPGDKLVATFIDLAQLKLITVDGRKASTGNATDNEQIMKVNAYVTYVGGAKELKTLLIKIQDFFCCDGAFVQNGAWDYSSGNRGDWAAGQYNIISTGNAESPNINGGNLNGPWNNTTELNAYFKPSAAGDICWYKWESTTKVSWPQAIQGCARGTYTDGDINGWYLPNLKELEFLYETFDKAGNGGIQNGGQELGTPEFFGGVDGGAKKLGTMTSGTEYWGSTEQLTGSAFQLNFNDGLRMPYTKASTFVARCVRRY